MNVWMYVVREFEDAIDGCTSCDSDCNVHSTNSGSVHAWDEGVAFYTGSPEGTAQAGVPAGGEAVLQLRHVRRRGRRDIGHLAGEQRALRAFRLRPQQAAAGLVLRRAAGGQPDRQPDDGAARAGRAQIRVQEQWPDSRRVGEERGVRRHVRRGRAAAPARVQHGGFRSDQHQPQVRPIP
eukprot:scaffold18106_cov66-Phaeocystis_antarctica.AAC.1